MTKRTFMTEKGPRSVGPYSTATIYNGFVFVSGMGPIDPNTNKVIASSVEEQARTMFTNVKTVLEELGSSMNDVLKVTLYLKDIQDFALVNQIYKEFFDKDYPARTTLQAGKLPLDFSMEVDVIAAYKEK
ncbi:MAG: RidA family protein [Clostridia bacterium]|jgi:2-iminobutanoate/2-iminopropanoate deaminase|nr:RidA family protein [Clostridiaceae bacterium]